MGEGLTRTVTGARQSCVHRRAGMQRWKQALLAGLLSVTLLVQQASAIEWL